MRENKRKWGDRWDGYRLRGLDPMHTMMPYMFGARTKNEAVVGEVMDLTAVDAYLARKNAAGPDFKYTSGSISLRRPLPRLSCSGPG